MKCVPGAALDGQGQVLGIGDQRAFAAVPEEVDHRLDLGSHAARREVAFGIRCCSTSFERHRAQRRAGPGLPKLT